MLKELSIRNFALIDNIQVEFHEGFNVLTGETGAGKSILLDSIGLLCGQRANGDFIRKGEEKALVEGYFELDEEVSQRIKELDLTEIEDRKIWLSREISNTGVNKCKVNYKNVPLGVYQTIGSLLFDIHGQNQEQSILSKDKQLELLDKYIAIEPENQAILEGVAEEYVGYAIAKKELESAKAIASESQEMLSYFEFAIKEIEEAHLEVGEEELLKEEKARITNSEKLSKKSELVNNLLNVNGVISQLDTVIFTLKEMSKMDPLVEAWIDKLEEHYYGIDEINGPFKQYYASLEYDEKRINQIVMRLDEINRLKRKYGNSIEGILEKQDEMSSKIRLTENKDQLIDELTKALEVKKDRYLRNGMKLREARRRGAVAIETAIRGKLEALNIYKDGFAIAFEPLGEPTAGGMDQIEFLFSPNKGEGIKPLRKIASGGEVSRVMLAFKGIFAEIDFIPTLIFDEIDAGIGGDALTKVAIALERIGNNRQVICVTHSAIIAAFAEHMLSVRKMEAGNRTIVEIKALDKEEERIEELARMLGGKNNFLSSIAQGREMISFAKSTKSVYT